jgi:hypothetical protein
VQEGVLTSKERQYVRCLNAAHKDTASVTLRSRLQSVKPSELLHSSFFAYEERSARTVLTALPVHTRC